MDRDLISIVESLPEDEALMVCNALSRVAAKPIRRSLLDGGLRRWGADLIVSGKSGREAAAIIAKEIRRYAGSAWMRECDWPNASVPIQHRRAHGLLRLSGGKVFGEAAVRKRLCGIARLAA
jgi:hypothetical protein